MRVVLECPRDPTGLNSDHFWKVVVSEDYRFFKWSFKIL